MTVCLCIRSFSCTPSGVLVLPWHGAQEKKVCDLCTTASTVRLCGAVGRLLLASDCATWLQTAGLIGACKSADQTNDDVTFKAADTCVCVFVQRDARAESTPAARRLGSCVRSHSYIHLRRLRVLLRGPLVSCSLFAFAGVATWLRAIVSPRRRRYVLEGEEDIMRDIFVNGSAAHTPPRHPSCARASIAGPFWKLQ